MTINRTTLIEQLRRVVADGQKLSASYGTVEQIYADSVTVRSKITGAVVRGVPVVGGTANLQVGTPVYLLHVQTAGASGSQVIALTGVNLGEAAAPAVTLEMVRALLASQTPPPPPAPSVSVSAGPDIDLVAFGSDVQIGRAGNRVLLFSGAGTVLAEFVATGAGLAAALAAAASGDLVQLPAFAIAGDITVPAGVKLVGLDRDLSVLAGTVTLSDGSALSNLTVSVAGSSSATLVAVVGPDLDETSKLDDCQIVVNQAGSGQAFGLYTNEGGDLAAYFCNILSTSAGLGYGAVTAFGKIRLEHGSCEGSTDRFLTIMVSG